MLHGDLITGNPPERFLENSCSQFKKTKGATGKESEKKKGGKEMQMQVSFFAPRGRKCFGKPASGPRIRLREEAPS